MALYIIYIQKKRERETIGGERKEREKGGK